MNNYEMLEKSWNDLFKKEQENFISEKYEAKESITDKNLIEEIKEAPKHYNNTNGSLYKYCEDNNINSYEFDIIKRVMRCRKKGNFREDLEKTKFLIDLYIKEYNEK